MSDQANKNDDKELNDLLDNALNDFKETTGSEDSKNRNDSSGDAAGPNDDANSFFIEQTKMFAERMNQTLAGGSETSNGGIPQQNPEVILAGFKKMAEAAALTLQGENPANDEEVAQYSSSIAQALKGLQEGADNLASPVSEDDVANMFSSLNLDSAGDGEGNTFLPFMEGMMQSLLSAEILLPSIKELIEKYPKYLEENNDKLSDEVKERYGKQLELYKVIAEHLESEQPDDSPAVKREKFKIVLDDMRKLQEFGQPPDEILAEAADLPMLDPNAMEGNTQNPQCPMM